MRIVVSKQAQKQLDIVPTHIYRKYLYWKDLLEKYGLLETRKIKGFHDEPLKGVGPGKGQLDYLLHTGQFILKLTVINMKS